MRSWLIAYFILLTICFLGTVSINIADERYRYRRGPNDPATRPKSRSQINQSIAFGMGTLLLVFIGGIIRISTSVYNQIHLMQSLIFYISVLILFGIIAILALVGKTSIEEKREKISSRVYSEYGPLDILFIVLFYGLVFTAGAISGLGFDLLFVA